MFRNYGKNNTSHPIKQELGSLPKINMLGRSYDNFCDIRKLSLKQSRKILQRKISNLNVISKECKFLDKVCLFICLFVCLFDCLFVCLFVCVEFFITFHI